MNRYKLKINLHNLIMSNSTRPRILVVDDEPMNVELIEAYLSSEYDIIHAYGGIEALEIAAREKLDLVLLDVMMPDLNGYHVCRKLKASPFSQFVPIILATALSGRDDRLKGIEAHADDFLTKPIDRLELEMRVKSLLRIKSLHDNLVYERDQAKNYFDVAGVMMVVLNVDYKVSHVNRRAIDILGYDEQEILGNDWLDKFVPVDARVSCDEYFVETLERADDSVVHYESLVLCKDGNKCVIAWYCKALKNEDGLRTGILCSGEDITQRKLAETKLNEYAASIQSSNELKDLFMDIMSHDLLNPAGVAKGFTDLLIHAEDDPAKVHKLELIDDSLTRLISMIEYAAEYAKLEDVRYLEFEATDIRTLVSDVAETFESQLFKKNLCLEVNLDSAYIAKINPLISAVFANFISNAIKYGPMNSSIIVEIDDLVDKFKIKVIDFGDGVSDKDKELIFNRFKRLEQTHKSVKGTGLGLAIAKRIVELHGGEVGVEDNPYGSGSVFWLTLKKP